MSTLTVGTTTTSTPDAPVSAIENPRKDINSIESKPFKRPYVNLYPSANDSGHIRSIPELVDFNAEHNPDHVFCVQARKQADKTSISLLSITNSQLKETISHCATWLKNNLRELQLPFSNENGDVAKGPPVALFMESDIGLLVHEIALMSLGVPVLLLSARLSPTAVQHLLKVTSTSAIIASSRLHATAREALALFEPARNGPALYSQPPYDIFMTTEPSSTSVSICHPNHYISEFDRSVLILHSSGTTGLPKPIYVPHTYLASFLTCHHFTSEKEAQGLNVSTLPLYHGFGLVAPGLAMGVGKTLCLPATSVVSSASSTIELLQATDAASLMSVPSILEDISLLAHSEGVRVLSKLDFVTFGGGLLKATVGDRLSASGVRILNHYGATECGPLAPIFVPQSDYDWRFFRLRKDVKMKIEEIALHAEERRFRLTTYPFGWNTSFEIQDQLVCNPNHPESDFNAVGRNDDVIVLATGEKVNPRILESLLCESGLVKSAIAFGDNRSEIGVIVEPTEVLSPQSHKDFGMKVWDIVLRANRLMDDHAKISCKEAVVIIPQGIIVPRTDKGSIARKEVHKLFDNEIAKAYHDLENSVDDASIVPLNDENLEMSIKELIQNRLSWKLKPDKWDYNDDLFELGMDSLQATRLRRFLLSAIPKSSTFPIAERIGREFVYMYPSVSCMANALKEIKPDGSVAARESELDRLVEEYIDPGICSQPNTGGKAVILLTGGTGSLGTYCLGKLVRLSSVTRVICLNRIRKDDESLLDRKGRQAQSVKTKGIDISEEQWFKVQVVQSNSASPLLGLTEPEYADIRGSVTHILHSAWPVDFKRKLPSFKTQFQTLRNLVNLAREAHKMRPLFRPRLLFISSIATVGQYSKVHSTRIVPEVPVDTIDCVNPIGYAEAKLVCERILERVAYEHGTELEVSYVRLGQLSGSPQTGFWNTTEHISALLKSSQRICALPQLQGTLSWIPIDSAATVISDILLSPQPPSLVYHVENPVRQSWNDVLMTLASELAISKLLPFGDWLDAACSAADGSVDANPAKKLEDFFRRDFRRMAEGEVIMGTDKARAVSECLSRMDAVGKGTMKKYVEYWKGVGFLD